jgi:hypothetical protein
MAGRKKWTHLWWLPGALVLATVACQGGANPGGIVRVDEDEGALVQGGQTDDCSDYKNNFVYCTPDPDKICDGTKCPTLNKLTSGTGVSAKNVTTGNDKSCTMCGGRWQDGYCAGNLTASSWDPCE